MTEIKAQPVSEVAMVSALLTAAGDRIDHNKGRKACADAVANHMACATRYVAQALRDAANGYGRPIVASNLRLAADRIGKVSALSAKVAEPVMGLGFYQILNALFDLVEEALSVDDLNGEDDEEGGEDDGDPTILAVSQDRQICHAIGEALSALHGAMAGVACLPAPAGRGPHNRLREASAKAKAAAKSLAPAPREERAGAGAAAPDQR